MNKQFFVLAERKGFDRKERTVTAWASQAIIDRDRELILASAWRKPGATAAFEKHPVLLVAHAYHSLPIGKVIKLEKPDMGLKFTAKFASTAAAVEAFDLIVELEGIAAFSVGFIPRDWNDVLAKDLKAAGFDIGTIPETEKIRTYTDVELLEISLVSIPANPAATAIGAAYRSGKVKTKELSAAIGEYLDITDDGRSFTKEEALQTVDEYVKSPGFKAHIAAAASAQVAELKKNPRLGTRIPDFRDEEARLKWLDNLLYSRLNKRFEKQTLRRLALKHFGEVKKPLERYFDERDANRKTADEEVNKIALDHAMSQISWADIQKLIEERVSLAFDKMRGIVR